LDASLKRENSEIRGHRDGGGPAQLDAVTQKSLVSKLYPLFCASNALWLSPRENGVQMLMGAPPIPVTVTLVTKGDACATAGPADTHMNIAMTAMDRTDNSLTS